MAPMALEKENHTRDADFMSAMHGKSASSQAGFSSMLKKDHASHKAAYDEYFKHFDNKSAKDETNEDRAVRRRPPFRIPPLVRCHRSLILCQRRPGRLSTQP